MYNTHYYVHLTLNYTQHVLYTANYTVHLTLYCTLHIILYTSILYFTLNITQHIILYCVRNALKQLVCTSNWSKLNGEDNPLIYFTINP